MDGRLREDETLVSTAALMVVAIAAEMWILRKCAEGRKITGAVQAPAKEKEVVFQLPPPPAAEVQGSQGGAVQRTAFAVPDSADERRVCFDNCMRHLSMQRTRQEPGGPCQLVLDKLITARKVLIQRGWLPAG
jgi:hypothetical protein